IPDTPGEVLRHASLAAPRGAVEAAGSTIRDADGREYLDAAGGAIVVDVGHGRRGGAEAIAAQAAPLPHCTREAMAAQASRLAYAHGSAFTTQPLESYASELGGLLPIDDPAIYPVSGGSE